MRLGEGLENHLFASTVMNATYIRLRLSFLSIHQYLTETSSDTLCKPRVAFTLTEMHSVH